MSDIALTVVAGIASVAVVVAVLWMYVWAAIQDGRENRRAQEESGAGRTTPANPRPGVPRLRGERSRGPADDRSARRRGRGHRS